MFLMKNKELTHSTRPPPSLIGQTQWQDSLSLCELVMTRTL